MKEDSKRSFDLFVIKKLEEAPTDPIQVEIDAESPSEAKSRGMILARVIGGTSTRTRGDFPSL